MGRLGLLLAVLVAAAAGAASERAPRSKRDVALGAYKVASERLVSRPPPSMRPAARQPLAAERKSFGSRLSERLQEVSNSTGPDGRLTPEAAGMVEQFFGAAGVPEDFFENFEVAQILSAFTTQEFIALADADASIDTIVLKDGGPLFEAKDVFVAAAAGFVQIYGFAVGLAVATAGAIDTAIAVEQLEVAQGGQVLPTQPGLGGRRLLQQQSQAEASSADSEQQQPEQPEYWQRLSEDTEPEHPFWNWMANRRSALGPDRETVFVANHRVTRDERERLVAAGFFDLFGNVLPEAMQAEFQHAVGSDPTLNVTAFQGPAGNNETSEYDPYEDFSLAEELAARVPTVEPVLDVEFVLALAAVGNNALAAVEFTVPSLRFAPGFFAIAAEADPFLAAFASLDKITAIDRAAIVAEAAANNATLPLAALFPQFVDFEAAIYILFREQISINGADITAVL